MEQWSFNDVVPFNLIVGVYKKGKPRMQPLDSRSSAGLLLFFLHTANEGHNNNQSNNDNNYLSS